jgi:hypothetical protein
MHYYPHIGHRVWSGVSDFQQVPAKYNNNNNPNNPNNNSNSERARERERERERRHTELLAIVEC